MSTRLVKPCGLLPGTAQQEAIWDAILHSSKHVLVDARAGSGKTFTNVQGVLRLPPTCHVGLFAFNVHIVKEINKRLRELNQHGRAHTFHSFGFSAVKRANPNIQLMEDKLPTIIRGYVPNDRDVAGSVARLVALCKNNLLDGRDPAALSRLIDRHGIPLPELREDRRLNIRASVSATYGSLDCVMRLCRGRSFDSWAAHPRTQA